MNRSLAAIVRREDDGHVSPCPDVEAASQGGTVQEARDTLEEVLALSFECAHAAEIDWRLRDAAYATRFEVAAG